MAALPKYLPSSHEGEPTLGCEALPLREVQPRAAGLSLVPPPPPRKMPTAKHPSAGRGPAGSDAVSSLGWPKGAHTPPPDASDSARRFWVENQYL